MDTTRSVGESLFQKTDAEAPDVQPNLTSLSDFFYQRYMKTNEKKLEVSQEMKQAFYNAIANFACFILLVIVVSLFYIFHAFIRPLLWAVLVGTFLFPFKKATSNYIKMKLTTCKSNNYPIVLSLIAFPLFILNDIGDFISSIFMSHWKLFLVSGILFTIIGWLNATILLPIYFLLQTAITICVAVSEYICDVIALHFSVCVCCVAAYFLTLFAFMFLKNKFVIEIISFFLMPIWMLTATLIIVYIGILRTPLFLSISILQIVAFCLIRLEKMGVKGELNASLFLDPNESIRTIRRYFNPSHGESLTTPFLSPVPHSDPDDHVEHVDTPSPFLEPSQHSAFSSSLNSSTDLISSGNDEKSSTTTMSTTFETPLPTPAIYIPTTLPVTPNPTQSKRGVGEKLFQNAANKVIHGGKGLNRKKVSVKLIHQDAHLLKKLSNRSYRDTLFLMLFWSCILYKLYHNAWMIVLFLLPLPLFLLKKGWNHPASSRARAAFLSHFQVDKIILFPETLTKVYLLYLKIDEKLFSWVKRSLDSLATSFIMMMLLVVSILVLLFLILEFRQETIDIIHMGSTALNFTATYTLATLSQFMDTTIYANQNTSSLFGYKFDDWSEQLYSSSRQWLVSELREFLTDDTAGEFNEESNLKLEQQLIDTFDNLFTAFRDLQNASTTRQSPNALFDPSNQNVTSWAMISEVINSISTSSILAFLKANLSVIVTIVKSVGELLLTNFGVIFLLSGKFVAFLLGGGQALINFFFSTIIFCTSLFYLLLYSEDTFFPGKLAMEFFPKGYNDTQVGRGISKAIASVFDASLRMSLFYGLYTWLVHSIFDTTISFIPSAFAAVAGMVPFFGTYWASIPGVLELWLIRGHSLWAVLFFVLHMLPSYVVDTVIYSEVEGGAHPYLTGLAVAGGVYFSGLEGALIGPILLCCLLSVLNLYKEILSSVTDSETKQTTS